MARGGERPLRRGAGTQSLPFLPSVRHQAGRRDECISVVAETRRPPKPPASSAPIKLPLLGTRPEGGHRDSPSHLWAATQVILEANAARLPYLQLPSPTTARPPTEDELRRHHRQHVGGHSPAPSAAARTRGRSRSLAASGSSRQINVLDRKSCQQAALDRDRQYVEQMFAQTAEQATAPETGKAVEDRWWVAIFAPVPNPREFLPQAYRERPPLRIDDASSPQGMQGPGAFSDPQLTLEFDEMKTILSVSRRFQALVAPRPPDGAAAESSQLGPPVLNRSSFCRLVCAMEGLSTGPGKRTWLSRAVMHFDRMAERIPVKGSSSGTVLGFLLAQTRLTSEVFDLPIFDLFSHLLFDMVKHIELEDGDEDATSIARARFFQILLPKAESYACARAESLRMYMEGACSPTQSSTEEERRRSSVIKAQAVQLRAGTEGSRSNGSSPDGKRSYSMSPSSAGGHDSAAEEGEDQEGEDESAATALYTHTFAVLKGELLTTQLLEPEVVHFTAQFSDVFKVLFDVYRDVPVSATEGHMTLKAFLRFCSDFGLFPQVVDFQTLQWLYSTAESCRSRTSQRRTLTRSSRSESQRQSKAASIIKDDGILFSGKWLRSHLAWLAKDLGSMSEEELAAASILWAMDDWLESQTLQLHEFFAFSDGGRKVVSAEDLRIGIDFMALEDAPSSADVRHLVMLLLPQQAGQERENPDIELELLQMAITAISRHKEEHNKSMNCFLKDVCKMTQVEYNASRVFREILHYMESRSMTAEQLFSSFDAGKRGAMPRTDFVQHIHGLFKLHPTNPVHSVQDPSELLELNSDGEITCEEFCNVLMKEQQAQEFRELHARRRHPILVTPPPAWAAAKQQAVVHVPSTGQPGRTIAMPKLALEASQPARDPNEQMREKLRVKLERTESHIAAAPPQGGLPGVPARSVETSSPTNACTESVEALSDVGAGSASDAAKAASEAAATPTLLPQDPAAQEQETEASADKEALLPKPLATPRTPREVAEARAENFNICSDSDTDADDDANDSADEEDCFALPEPVVEPPGGDEPDEPMHAPRGARPDHDAALRAGTDPQQGPDEDDS